MSSHPVARTAAGSLPLYEPGRDAEAVAAQLGRTVVKLASNESPFGASPQVDLALREQIRHIHRYPDAGGTLLRAALAERWSVNPEQVLLGNGSVELIENTAKAFLDPGDEAIMAVPSFLKFRIATRLMAGTPVEIPTCADRVDLQAMAGAITERTRIIFVANPDNPTGQMVDADDLMRFIDLVPHHVVIFLDQAYYEYVAEQSPPLAPLLERRNVLVSRTFSKAYGLAGMRIGYGLAHPELAAAIGRVREHFNTSSPAQIAALAALSDPAHVDAAVADNDVQRARLTRELEARGLRVTPSFTNFLLVRGAERGFLAGVQLDQALLERGVIVRPMGFYGLGDAVRISVGTAPEIDRLLEALDTLA